MSSTGRVADRVTGGARNGGALTLTEVGRAFGLTRERVRQIEHEAIAKVALGIGENEETARMYIAIVCAEDGVPLPPTSEELRKHVGKGRAKTLQARERAARRAA